MRDRTIYGITIALFLSAMGMLVAAACGTTLVVPTLPAATATADSDVRTLVAGAYADIHAFNDILNDASKLENDAAVAGHVSDAPVRAQFVAVAKASKAILDDIHSGALKGWAAIKLRVDPLITQVNGLLKLASTPGVNWAAVLSAGLTILTDLANNGAFGG